MLYNSNNTKEVKAVPPKAKATKDMIINAAFNVVREAGVENINARTVAKKLLMQKQTGFTQNI